jgi:hypothetical protein
MKKSSSALGRSQDNAPARRDKLESGRIRLIPERRREEETPQGKTEDRATQK